jgi:hypothetical protein
LVGMTIAPAPLRIQRLLPDRYTTATPELLERMIREAKAHLGERLLILGHHYQRSEIIRWADLRGDSFKLARFAQDTEAATDIVFCGVHFMAEAADILTGDHQRVILPDLNAGCSMADMADIAQVEGCVGGTGAGYGYRACRTDHLYEFLSRHQSLRGRQWRSGVHLLKRPSDPRMGVLPGRSGAVFPRSTPRP